ncbi:hypothetical protein QW060_21445 [Myroides ceti]|uniref:Uncharacterized protein n=1 Tax=Paenimyroides ceti TaxID=395087 RepID=A0ABT8CZ74_9FLAO|nr:hypothetical protein [Paenimyroides ceti]MDN3708367.1 hypothetical protein [Paenimyroides ceti]MDN3709542.1 hypothetical protein [Paenimyroides ceti]
MNITGYSGCFFVDRVSVNRTCLLFQSLIGSSYHFRNYCLLH